MIQTKKPDWGKRIERAADLAERHPSSTEVLRFYGRILDFQKTLYENISTPPTANPDVSFRERLNVDTAMQYLPALLALVRRAGPAKLAQQATEIAHASQVQQRYLLLDSLTAPEANEAAATAFFVRVLFQPLAEDLATHAIPPAGFSGPVCPVCGARPQAAVLRPEGDGGKRFLICSFCVTEWEFRRILCPFCGEEDYQRLPRYSAEDLIAVRVEACDTCHYYLKSVDMTVDGLAVPVVDEIATAPLDLWAAEHGYTKISRNLMGF
jgi:FdhE protein